MIKIIHCKSVCFVGFFGGLFCHSAVAQSTGEMEPVVVTATRTAQIADQSLTPTIVISAQDIQLSQSRDVAELLRFHAGIELSRNGGPGQATSLFVRGTDSDHVIVMINGVKINADTVAVAAVQNIDPDLIERIEIVKGPRSSLYGSEGIGGVINIITRKSDKPDDIIQATAGAGSDNTSQAGFSYHTKVKKTRIGFDAKYFNTDGFPTVTTSAVDRGFKNSTLNAYLDVTAGATDIGLSFWTAQGTTEYMQYNVATNQNDIPVDQDFKNSVGALSMKTPISSYGTAKLTLSQIIDDITQNQSADRSETIRQAIDFQSDFDVNENNLLTAGLYYANEEVNFVSFGAPLPEDADNNIVKAVFVQDDFKFSANHLVAALRYTDDDNFGNKTTYNVDYGYAISTKIRLLAGVGTGFRAPTPVDLYGFGGNSNLAAETSQNVEVGSRYRLDDHHSFSLSLYQNDIDNLINWNSATNMLENIGQARIRGMEFGYRLQLKNWASRIDVILQDPVDLSTGEILLRRAKRSLTAAIQYHLDSHTFGADLLATGERQDFDTTLDSYAIVNLNYLYRLNASWQLKTHIENLFDKQYQIASGYNTQGFFIMLNIEYKH
ncbi:TonB-dependent receptor domain-containing protein [Kaarinaea lacus]